MEVLGDTHAQEGVVRARRVCVRLQVFGEGNGNSLLYSCPENLMDRGAWWAIVHGIAKSQTHLKQLRTYIDFNADDCY